MISREFDCPVAIRADIQAFKTSKAPAQQILALPELCEQVLNQPQQLQPNHLDGLAATFSVIDAETELDEEFRIRARIAVASTLIARGAKWLDQNKNVKDVARHIVSDTLATIADTSEYLRSASHDYRDHLSFLAYAVFEDWLNKSTIEADAAVMKVMTRRSIP